MILLKTEIFSLKIIPALLIILFVIQGMLYAGMYPLWEGWDEPNHFAYVQHIAEKKTLPTPMDKISREIGLTIDKVPLSPFLVSIPWETAFTYDKGTLNQNLAEPGKNVQDFWKNYTLNEILENKNSLSEISFSDRINTIERLNGEAKNPPLAYITQVPIYLLMYDQGIFERAFALRIFSVLVTARFC